MSNEYLTSNEQVAYPFMEGAPGLAAETDNGSTGATPYLPRDFLLDAVITARPASNMVYLRSIENVGGDYVFTFYDATYEVLVHTLTAIPAERSVVHMTDDNPPISGTGDEVFIQVVTGPSFAAYLGLLAPGAGVDFGTRLPFETAVVELRPDKIRSFASSSGTGYVYLTGDIALAEGYNCDLSASGDGLSPEGRDGTQVTITLSPELGLGRYPCEGLYTADYLATLSGVVPDENGNINFVTDGCHKIMPIPLANKIQIENECVAPCTCDQYAAMVEALRLLYARAERLKLAMDRAVSQLNSDIAAFNADGCTSQQVVVSSVEGAIGLDSDGDETNLCVVDIKLTVACVGMPASLTAKLDIPGMPEPVSPTFGRVMGVELTAAVPPKKIVSVKSMTTQDVSDLIGSGYSVPPELLKGSFVEIKVGLETPPGTLAHCPSATASYTGITAPATGKW